MVLESTSDCRRRAGISEHLSPEVKMFEFKVLALAVLVLAVVASAAPLVTVQFYEESGCPDCQNFITSALNATLSKSSVVAVMDLQVVPWGNAYHAIAACPSTGPGYDRNARFCWVTNCAPNVTSPPADCYAENNIVCQHGALECQANDVEMCVVHTNPAREQQVAIAAFLYCLEITYSLDLSFVPVCAAASGFDMDAINQCTTSSLLSKLKVQFAQQTAALGVAKAFVPWVTVRLAIVCTF